jgi:molecular chaperone DnaK (HSP70)
VPFRRDDDAALLWAHLVDPPPPLSGFRPDLTGAVDAVVARAMAKNPADRYGSCEELLRDLEPALGTPAPVSPPAGPPVRDRLPAPGPPRPVRAAGAAGYSLAIDLGTSFVAAAVADDRGPEMVGLGDGAVVAPAAVCVSGDGRLLTGAAAARRAASRPDRAAWAIRRNLGDRRPLVLGGAPYPPGDLLAALLRDVLVRVAEQRGAEPEVVALTHPATWAPARLESFRSVAHAAGLTDPLHLTEPEAAATRYASAHPLAEGDALAVYDLGGGTFDATVLRRTAQGFSVVGTPDGIERLGGAAFDDAVLARVDHLAGGPLADLDPDDPHAVVALARLRQECTLAKEALSVDVEATVPVLLPHRHLEVRITRAELEGILRVPIEATIRTLDRVLRAAQVDRAALTAVLLAGASVRIPLVARMVSAAFGRPAVVARHPKHDVALGAAVLAEALRKDARRARGQH